MPRSKDLDTIAPDDLIVSPTSTPPQPKVVKKVKKTTKPVTAIPQNPVITTPSTPVNSETPPEQLPPVVKTVYDIFGHTKHPFSSALVMPKVLSFTEKDNDETILVALRSHWFTNVGWILTTIFMLFVPTLIRFIPATFFSPTLGVILGAAWYLVTFAYAFEQFLSWYFDLFIITDRRVVDIDFNNLLDKKFSEADIGRIQDVSSRVSGVSQTFFNYGNVLIQTAAEQNVIMFEKVPHPDKVMRILQELRDIEESKFALNGGTN